MDRPLKGLSIILICAFAVAACNGPAAPSFSDATPPESVRGAGLPSGLVDLPIDIVTPDCVGDMDTRLAVVQIQDGPSFYALFPLAGFAPELNTLRAATVVVVYRAGYPGPIRTVPGTGPRKPEPGTVDACLEAPNNALGQPSVVYLNIPLDQSPLSR